MEINFFSKIIQNCLHQSQTQSMSNRKFWNSYYLEQEQELITKPDPLFLSAIQKYIFPLFPQGSALELGAGAGAEALWLAKQGWNLTALDFAPSAMKRLSKITQQRQLALKTIVADASDFLPILGMQKFDLIYLCYLHLLEKKRKQSFAQAYQCLKKEGVLFYIGLDDIENYKGFACQKTICQQLASYWDIFFQTTKKTKVAINNREKFAANVVIVLAKKMY